MHNKLTHYSVIGQYQFITFRTHDSIDDYVKKVFVNNNLSTSQREHLIDEHLDNSNNGAYLYGDAIACVKNLLLKYEENGQFNLESFCVMPNHMHILLKQKVELPTIVQQIKGGTSYSLNRLLQRKGTFWSPYYFDKAIRDEKHMEIVYNYIMNNPLKAGLNDSTHRVWSRY